MSMHVKKGDQVKMLSGADRGKSGTVLAAFPKKDKVLVEGVRIVKRHEKPRRQNQKGQIVERPMPVHISNVTKL